MENLYWYKSCNFGDMLSVYLLSKYLKVNISEINTVDHNSPVKKYILNGSILSVKNIKNAIIYGAGFVGWDNEFKAKNVKVKGIRGNLSLQKIPEKYRNNTIVGELSLTLPFFYNPKIEKKYKIGIIPHLVDVEKAKEFYNNEIFIVDVQFRDGDSYEQYIERIIDQILECEVVISSSLHGLIAAFAYGVPCDWGEFSDIIIGNRFKFYDFLDTVIDISNLIPINIHNKVTPFDLLYYSRKFVNKKLNVQQIFDNFPYESDS